MRSASRDFYYRYFFVFMYFYVSYFLEKKCESYNKYGTTAKSEYRLEMGVFDIVDFECAFWYRELSP